MMHYHVSALQAASQTFDVELTFVAPVDRPVLRLPVWTPGSYMVREFSRFLGEVHATDRFANAVPVQALDKASWVVDAPAGTELRVFWNAWCNELTVRTPHADSTHAFFTGTNLLLYVDQLLSSACTMAISAPTGWEVFCALPFDGGRFTAGCWDTLADAPVEIGPHPHDSFEVDGIPHRVIYWGAQPMRLERTAICEGLQRCVVQNAQLFGGLPYSNYDFILHITPDMRGGLEHLNATVLACPWRFFESEKGFAEFLSLAMHEHFHVWNIKRIKPSALVPFQYQTENYTTALWVAEGFTSYYDDYNCLRAGITTLVPWLELMSDAATRLGRLPGRTVQSLTRSSFDAWIRLYRPDANSGNRTVSYYLKGGLVAWLLDLTIRERSGGSSSLDDVMLALWREVTPAYPGFDEARMGEFIRAHTGVDVTDALNSWVYGTDELPWQTVLDAHGFVCSMADDADSPFGWLLDSGGGIRNLIKDGPAMRAGLAPGDRLVAVDSRAFELLPTSVLERRLVAGSASMEVHYFRRGQLRSTVLEGPAHVTTTITFSLREDATEAQLRLRHLWLGLGEA